MMRQKEERIAPHVNHFLLAFPSFVLNHAVQKYQIHAARRSRRPPTARKLGLVLSIFPLVLYNMANCGELTHD